MTAISCITGAFCDSYLLHCGKYIELNPVRAGIVSQPHEYAFSSYKHYSLGYPDALISDSPVFLGLADNSPKRREQYIAFVVDSGIINTDSLAKQAFIGSKDFINKFQGRAAKEGKNLEASPGFPVCWDPPCPIGSADVSATSLSLLVQGNVGIGTTEPARTLHVAGANGMHLNPSSRPFPASAGDIVIDSDDSNKLKYHDGNNWKPMYNIYDSGWTFIQGDARNTTTIKGVRIIF